ncbi:bifunctional transcriptional regulator/O-phospho-L-serine synthase SbnI [Staphylococcus arlettae]|uniref:bifunctional transcriptional regulator/O-phospho-L-serine synthase SbnI n=1 Tax=Staphylococcus arlettae TaxID=29378 RepID=UPI000D1B1700|nr:bifunctional transcriptional regulator/O-phospho-L-serine synthase SbnI [Staphylococcus arlettae]PTH26513.1 bifunctional transcriptional regulator/O-phospho-L-serine synthase SbnI [Staphylococcus arlettae]PTH53938.1 bifunctional transcriptional regulator/O-phospho-L-serine synthase SbnI [Staphylococcus arlettae]PTH56563.1 bifunctional transcriptional regulator/O-phospho-L-serine synthase SbnI [Staphylococcus arlettae]PUZ32240.1 bifunctional transcriptional regulator/O-phospho-L-serine syntha
MQEVYQQLQLVPVERIDLHEDFEPSRLTKTQAQIAADQFIRHPILVVQLQSGRYMVIDGVHRFTSLKALGCNAIPVQVIDEHKYVISTWHHRVSTGAWWQNLQQDSALPWTTEVRQVTPFITVCQRQQEQYLYADDLGQSKLAAWSKVVASYSNNCAVERIAQGEINELSDEVMLLKYQPLDITEIEAVVARGETVPAGVTRFNISGRCLNLQVPLHILTEEATHVRMMKWHNFLDNKINSIRCYAEKVFLVEQ